MREWKRYSDKTVILSSILIFIVLLSSCNHAVKPSKQSTKTENVTIDSLGITYPVPNQEDIIPIEKTNSNGNTIATIEDLKKMITPDDIKKVRSGNYTVAVSMHEYYTQWSFILNKGLADTLSKFNIKVLQVTDGKMDTNTMNQDIRRLAALKPTVMVIYGIFNDTLTESVNEVLSEGIKVEFFVQPTSGLKYPRDYGAIINPDDFQMGYQSAEMLAKRINGKGKIAILEYASPDPESDERERGFREALSHYPNIKIASIEKFTNNEDAAKKTENIIKKNSDLKGIWCTWDQPAMAAASVIQNMGRQIYVSGPDIGKESAYSLTSNGLFVGTGSQQPYLQGVAQALNIVLVLSGKTPPRYVQTPVLKVTRENLSSVWKVIFHEKLDQRIMDAYKK